VDVIADIEDALVAQWSLFGRWPKGALHDEDGLLRARAGARVPVGPHRRIGFVERSSRVSRVVSSPADRRRNSDAAH
jgi:hypothetical protein